MYLIDTHTHLYSEAFDEDRENTLKQAMDQGVEQFFLPAIDSGYTEGMLRLKQEYPRQIHLMAGLHPTHVKPETLQAELQHVHEQLQSAPYVAVGEIGIDLYWEQGTLAIQQEAFRQQIAWAKTFDLPIIIHCREAFDAVFEVLESEKDDRLRGIFHCFTGTEVQAQHAIDLNLKLGIGGVITFKNGKIDQFLHRFDLSHIVLETDAPYLAPTPFRGKRNTSAYLPIIAEKVAAVYGIPVKEVARTTTKNAFEIFNMTEEMYRRTSQSNLS